MKLSASASVHGPAVSPQHPWSSRLDIPLAIEKTAFRHQLFPSKPTHFFLSPLPADGHTAKREKKEKSEERRKRKKKKKAIEIDTHTLEQPAHTRGTTINTS